ncbi:MerR family transcriptional regulator [Enterococcus sp.]|uniref:MerR family transcriptional regulator n=1 Tax=Enterococcus sp. TaxID=35783 RepID=UPI00290E6E34|nr:MerR family transcriptional regulator [Enterococcus sp.]MDU5334568.1 MerR family transcriptional regulator [Enterococcus sp.]
MLKIGEFSQLGQVSIRTLRHYDEIDLLHPILVDEESGYRYYSVKQLEVLGQIVLLRELKFSLKEIKSLIQQDPKIFTAALLKKDREIEKEIQRDQFRQQQIHQMIQRMKHKGKYQVTIKNVPACTIVSLRKKIKSFYHEGLLWEEFKTLLEKQQIEFPPEPDQNLTIFHDKEYLEEGVDVEVAIVSEAAAQSPLKMRQLPELEHAAIMFVEGNYHQLPEAYQSFAKWLDEHPEFEMVKATRQICHIGPEHTDNPEEYLTELQIPLIPLTPLTLT